MPVDPMGFIVTALRACDGHAVQQNYRIHNRYFAVGTGCSQASARDKNHRRLKCFVFQPGEKHNWNFVCLWLCFRVESIT